MPAFGDDDPGQGLGRQAVADVVDERRHVVEAVGPGHHVVPDLGLGVLLEGPVQVADFDLGVDDAFPVELQHQPDDAVHGGVGRAHVEHIRPPLGHFIPPQRRADGVEAGIFGRLPRRPARSRAGAWRWDSPCAGDVPEIPRRAKAA